MRASRAIPRPRRAAAVRAGSLLAAGALLAACASYASSTSASYAAPPPFPYAGGHPTPAEQAATLVATEGYRRLLVTRTERLLSDLRTLGHAAQTGHLDVARAAELHAQGDFDAIRGDLATDSATALELDGERWSVGAGRFGGLHLVERELWGHVDLHAAAGAVAGLRIDVAVTAYELSRAVLSPAQILEQAQAVLAWTVAVPDEGREELYSHHDLVDVAASATTARVALALVTPLARLVAPSTARAARTAVDDLCGAVGALGPPGARVDGSIALATWQALATDADAAQAELGALVGDVQGFGSGRLYA